MAQRMMNGGTAMQIKEVDERTPALIETLTALWEASVRATHTFLSEAEILTIKAYVPEALQGVAHLVTASDGEGPVGFMGVQDGRLEMLFLAPAARGRGLGRQLLEMAVADLGVRTLTVNEQNPAAVGFYEHMGFRAYKRSALDEQGAPYPLLYMERLDDQKNE